MKIANFPCLVVCVILSLYLSLLHAEDSKVATPDVNGARGFGYLKTICEIGPRISGSAGMIKQQQLIVDHFRKLGAQVAEQSFDAPHPLSGEPVRMKNMVISWHPEQKDRILLCCHYDTRPFPDQDRRNPRGRFIGANDGASGVALFMEMAHHIKALDVAYGVDMVLFDGEELVFNRGDKYFLGSEYFATEYRDNPPAHKYKCGVLVDMIAGKPLRLYYERNSLKYAPKVTQSVWKAAADKRNRAFVPRARHEVLDDHIPLNEIAKIPTTDLIDFDYRYWHTTADAPQNCSAKSLESVADVLLYWIQVLPGLRE
ncbi:M28 family peptidase [Planctomycetaceae bacterium]|nr:M28 family peptidase [Planctomycetaceae bacterium]MDC0273246.1 M28 family peptidase [Planctomycetaceae bacterium]